MALGCLFIVIKPIPYHAAQPFQQVHRYRPSPEAPDVEDLRQDLLAHHLALQHPALTPGHPLLKHLDLRVSCTPTSWP